MTDKIKKDTREQKVKKAEAQSIENPKSLTEILESEDAEDVKFQEIADKRKEALQKSAEEDKEALKRKTAKVLEEALNTPEEDEEVTEEYLLLEVENAIRTFITRDLGAVPFPVKVALDKLSNLRGQDKTELLIRTVTTGEERL